MRQNHVGFAFLTIESHDWFLIIIRHQASNKIWRFFEVAKYGSKLPEEEGYRTTYLGVIVCTVTNTWPIIVRKIWFRHSSPRKPQTRDQKNKTSKKKEGTNGGLYHAISGKRRKSQSVNHREKPDKVEDFEKWKGYLSARFYVSCSSWRVFRSFSETIFFSLFLASEKSHTKLPFFA